MGLGVFIEFVSLKGQTDSFLWLICLKVIKELVILNSFRQKPMAIRLYFILAEDTSHIPSSKYHGEYHMTRCASNILASFFPIFERNNINDL